MNLQFQIYLFRAIKAKATPGDEANVYEIRNVHSTDGVVTQSIYKNGSLVLNKDLDQMFENRQFIQSVS